MDAHTEHSDREHADSEPASDPNEDLRREEELVAPEEASNWLPEAEPSDGDAPAP